MAAPPTSHRRSPAGARTEAPGASSADRRLLLVWFVLATAAATAVTWLGFVAFARTGSGTPLAPLALLVAITGYVVVPVAVSRRRRSWAPLWCTVLALVPLGVLFLVLVWPEVRGRI